MRYPGAAVRGAILSGVAAVLSMATPAAVARDGFPQQVIVKYRDPVADTGMAGQALTERLSVLGQRRGLLLARLRRLATGAELIRVDRDLDDRELRELLAELSADPRVEYAEEDRIMKPLRVPNDSRYSEQWHLSDSVAGIRAPAAWDLSTGSGVTIAILDTGYRPHADFGSAVVGGYDFISSTGNNDGNGRDADAADPGDYNAAGQCGSGSPASASSWHGTHVAGIAAARADNALGVAGVAFDARLLPVRVLGRCGGTTSDIADAIIWASGGTVSGVPANAYPARVLNLSLGGDGSCSATTQAAINSARSRRSTVVVAAGNSNANAANESPANCSGVITVASVGRSGGRAYYSNFGSVVEIAAPGGDQQRSDANGVLSTFNAGTRTPAADSYTYYQGTSMAAPVVAGVAALLYAQNPSITPDQVLARLQATARPFPATCSQCGAGIVDAAAALGSATPPPPPPPPPSACPSGYVVHTGSLARSGSSVYEPGSGGFTVAAGAALNGRLSGPDAADFDLYLQRRATDGTTWANVASSTSGGSTEAINATGSSAYRYRWRVYSYEGSGAYTFCSRPK
ncbi:S8 family peptidase [Nevskia sp.]|uniref:S8 family peptidase n=1 Tax=Nevskia sp. TaxID=1929292 RepID=UPI003F6EA673